MFSPPWLCWARQFSVGCRARHHRVLAETLVSPLWVILVAQLVKNLPAMRETWVRFLGSKDPLEKGTATHSSILPGEFHGQRSLAGYSPCGHKEADTTE